MGIFETQERMKQDKLKYYEERIEQIQKLETFQNKEIQEYQEEIRKLQQKYQVARADTESLNSALQRHEQKKQQIQDLLRKNLVSAMGDMTDLSCSDMSSV